MSSLQGSPIAHIVAWRLNGATPEERIRQANTVTHAFETLRTQIPGLLQMEVGANVIEAPDAWDVALYMVFASRDALDAYQTHPGHLKIKTLVGPMRSARVQADFFTSG